MEFFRQVVAHYVNEYDVPELDVAAALALTARGEEPLLLDPEPERPSREGRDLHPDSPTARATRSHGPQLAGYRIAVGKRHRVTPRHIVGALANEGGLRREDFGHIDIRLDHSLVELPATLPQETWEALRSTRISGKLIELSRATDRARGPRKEFSREGRAGKRKGPR